MKAGPEADLVALYRSRLDGLGRGVALGPLEIDEVDPRGRAADTESEALLARLGDAEAVVALDERGDDLTSAALSGLLCGWRDDGRRAARFLIGGADGHSAALRKRADRRLRFGRATWPHMLVRAMLAEQLYRAVAIAR